jgi:hypothetical protein
VRFIHVYIYIILRARWAERKALFAAVVAIRADAVYNGCTITMHARLYILLESESEREQEGELEREQSPYIWSLFQKDPFSLDFFFSRPMTRLPGLKAPEYARTRTHTHTHTPRVVSTTGAVYGAQSFYGRSFVFFIIIIPFVWGG